MKKSISLAGMAIEFAFALACNSWHADEGMWLFNDLPVKHLKEKHRFTPTAEWSEHVMKSSVQFNVGGSTATMNWFIKF